MTTLRQSGLITLLFSTLLLHGCGSDANETLPQPVAPQLSVSSDITIKEHRDTTLTATGSSGTFKWTQLSGPELQLLSTDSSTVKISTPSVSEDTKAVLQVSLTSADNQTISKQVTVFIKNNLPPQISVNFKPYREKTSGSFSVEATDSDGTIKSYEWKQLRGPDLKMTGANTATIQFTVPAVIDPNQFVTISVRVTDDDGDAASYIYGRPIEQNMLEFKLTGRLTDPALAGATVVAHKGSLPVVTKAGSNGEFNLTVSTDDDETNLMAVLQAIKADNDKLSYYALIPDLASRKATDTILLNAFSTAWYAALLVANDGKAPTDLTTLKQAEHSADVTNLTEQAAVLDIIVNGKAQLPASSDSLTSLLLNKTHYADFVYELTSKSPRIVNETTEALLANSQLLPANVSLELPQHSIFEISAAVPGFFGGGSIRFEFTADQNGLMTNAWVTESFKWEQNQSQFQLSWQDFSYQGPIPITKGLMGMTSEQVDLFRRRGEFSLNIKETYLNSTVQMLIRGYDRDVFHIKENILHQMEPFRIVGCQLPECRIDKTEDQFVKSRTVQALRAPSPELSFKPEELAKEWSAVRFSRDKYAFGLDYEVDPLTFTADGRGKSENDQQPFRWKILTDGSLHIRFADNSMMQMRKLATEKKQWLVYTSYAKSSDIPERGILQILLEDTADRPTAIVNTANSYWQSVGSLMSAKYWRGNKLQFMTSSNESVAFGYQFNSDNTVNAISASNVNFPQFVPVTLRKLNWSVTTDIDGRQLIRAEASRSCEAPVICYVLELKILKVVQGVMGKRIYVQQTSKTRESGNEPFVYEVGKALRIYEEIPFSYFNQP